MKKIRRTCCYISARMVDCLEDARWEIESLQPGLAPYDCVTDSCTIHVGEMLNDAPYHTVSPIKEERVDDEPT